MDIALDTVNIRAIIALSIFDVYNERRPIMAISFRSTPKHTTRDRTVDAILSKEDFEDAVAAVNMTLADIAKQTGINRQYLSEFKCGDRNLRAEMRQTLRDFFEAKGVEFVAADFDDDDELLLSTRPTRGRSLPDAQVFPLPTIAFSIGTTIPEADRAAAVVALDAIVQKNNLNLATVVSYGFLFSDDIDDESKTKHTELCQGLTAEAILRRVLDGSFTARSTETKATNHADLIAQQFLGALPSTAGAVETQV